MLNYLKSIIYSLIITGLFFILLTGCALWDRGKTDVLIEIDLNQKGKPFNPDIYERFFKATPHENDLQWKKAIRDFADSMGQKDTLTISWDGVLRDLSVTHGKPLNENLDEALWVAAFRVEMEHITDIMHASSFATKEDMKLGANLMVYNCGKTYATPSYYAIRLFSENRPDKVMPTNVTMQGDTTSFKKGSPLNGQFRPSVYATAGIQEKSGLVIIKIVNPLNTPKTCKIALKYSQQIKYKGEVTVMTSKNIMDENSFIEPEKVVPMTNEINGLKNTFNYECPANAIVIIKLRYKKGIAGGKDCC